jgi:RimJ/RimL family protein N-acetyltransferase
MRTAPAVFLTLRLIATAFDDSRLPELVELAADPQVMSQLDAGTLGEADAREWVAVQQERWRADGVGLWVLAEAQSGAIVGCAGLQRVSAEVSDALGAAGAVELLFALRPAFWAQGLGREIGSALLGVAFGALELPEVVAQTLPVDTTREQLLRWLGFSPFGTYLRDGDARLLFRVTAAAASSTAVAIVG